ncbi:diacylglycerol kinase family protein [Sporosarcina oncorhynchi]|uniref:Diacylglycerol kinase family protein n=1 Tax=Sporosarcina oncorhynchi TaxID=3056444 RepID=A0ABZ0L8E2_9BACL|nr:diacylglycerol kinase family protein [Sporosarcina sp. T2O-4]WOV88822.1 diacylglycerol kinase family protein [Sporosarcina sp. T2O-4]
MRAFFKAFHYAAKGIVHSLRSERNMKFHTIALIFVTIAGLLTGLSITEWMIILILFGGMLSLEMLNTAIERVVDLVTTDHHPLAGQAKDVGSGAVLVFAIISAVIGLIIFLPKWF